MVPTVVHKPSHSSKSSAAAPAAFGKAEIISNGAVDGKGGDMISTAPKKRSASVKPSAAASGENGKAGIVGGHAVARKMGAGKSKEQTTGPKPHSEQLKNPGTLLIPK
ncbi:hypothetical protein LTR15_004139 [Elasticomyces elasticus]|nr:hypothetical protein LTR15_004139 [Elasticomyces elasticus]